MCETHDDRTEAGRHRRQRYKRLGHLRHEEQHAKCQACRGLGQRRHNAKRRCVETVDRSELFDDEQELFRTSNTKTNVNISVEQQTEIRTLVKEVQVAPVKKVTFTVSVGTKIPKKARLEPLPPRW